MTVRIGVAGPSCSGKTTVARIVAARLGARLFTLDDYYVRGHVPRLVPHPDGEVRSYEHPAAYDGARLMADMMSHDGPVVAEGFLLFLYPGMAEAMDVAAYVDVPWEETLRRRRSRAAQCRPAVNAAFERIGRAEWMTFGPGQATAPGVLRLDGTLPVETMVESLLGAPRLGLR